MALLYFLLTWMLFLVYVYVCNRDHDLEDLTDDEALFEELEREDDDAMAAIREQRIRDIQNE
jgi:hypothetical protein